ncbi:MAG TPA: plastocyanin/azurin family copper-binding protein [bacterium]|nr:plastocyanin/azurin family copper-binding protein [bacterium]
MKNILVLSFLLCSLILVAVACSQQSATVSPITSSPTATPTASGSSGVGANVSYGGSLNYSPAGVTITHGQSVAWDSTLSGHTVFLDNYSGTAGTCGSSANYSSFPVTVSFPTAGTYYYHCSVPGHSPCGSSTCGQCTGMAGFVQVN